MGVFRQPRPYIPEASERPTEFYLEANGASPVEEFQDKLHLKTRAVSLVNGTIARARNVRARERLVKHFEGDLWKLREASQTNIYRIVFLRGFHPNGGSAAIMKKHRATNRFTSASGQNTFPAIEMRKT